MYTIHVDGKLLYQAGSEDEAQIALNVKPSLDIESAGSLSFVLPPGNAQYDSIHKMKSIITMHQDGKLIFRGRATETERDIYNQKDVYCEGDRSFLLDSMWEEQVWQGKVQAFFRNLIDNHNAQVEPEKRFTVGIITAVDAEVPYEAEFRVETRKFWETSTVLDDRLLGVYGGYLRTRTEGDVTYIDWLKDFEEENSQPIRFSVNLLDLKDKLDAKDVFTCLIPLGWSEIGDDGTYSDPVNIKSVNDGLEYIQDDEAVALYGKIWRSKTWGMTKDPAELKAKGLEYLKTGAEVRTLTLKAVDMHFTDGSIEMLSIGKKVQIDSDPHGISLNMVLAKMEPDTENPDNTEYTFGVKPRTLSEAVIRTEKDTSKLSGKGGRGGGGGRSVQQEAQDILRWAKISVDEDRSKISLMAGVQYQEIDGSYTLKQADIDVNGDEGKIGLLARVNDAESTLYVSGDGILAKVSKNGLISSINQSAETVTIDASKINLNGYVTMNNYEAWIADLEAAFAESIVTANLNVTTNTNFTCSVNALAGLKLNGNDVSTTKIPVVTSFTQASGESAPTTEYTLLTTAAGEDTTCTAGSGETVTF